MSRPRTVTVTLTQAEYDALASAVAVAVAEEWGGHRQRTLDRAWEKLRNAWHGDA